MSESNSSKDLDMEVDEGGSSDDQQEHAVMNMFASVWLKTEMADEDGHIEDNLNDLDYKPPGLIERYIWLQ